MFKAFCRLKPGISLMVLHGELHQLKRMEVYDQFCRKQRAVLFATDLASRGLGKIIDFFLNKIIIQTQLHDFRFPCC